MDDPTIGELDRRFTASLDNISCRIGSLEQAVRDLTDKVVTRGEYEAYRTACERRLDEMDERIDKISGVAWKVTFTLLGGLFIPIVLFLLTRGL